ncbi:MAG TPA: dipeptidase PepV [Bacilli bacterium]|nr:dipeptidase PepV [Bacilli bacterium]
MNFLTELKKVENQFIKHTQELLQIKSVLDESSKTEHAPLGQGIQTALEYMLELGRKEGFVVENVDNLAGHIEYGDGDEIIGILCHLDVVPEGDGWMYPPYSATIKDGKIFARGAIDDKGPTMAAFYALKMIKDLGIKLTKKVRIILGTDEETSWRCVNHYFKKHATPTIGFAPDADFPLIYGEKGIMSIDFERDFLEEIIVSFKSGERYNVVPEKAVAMVNQNYKQKFMEYLELHQLNGEVKKIDNLYQLTLYGKSAHAMQPEKGINAATKLASFLSQFVTNPVVNFIEDYFEEDTRLSRMGQKFKDPEMGDLTCNMAIVDIDTKKEKMGINLRYPVRWDKDKFLNQIKLKATEYGLNMTVKSDTPPHYVNPEDELVQTLMKSYVTYSQDTTNKPKTIGGGTYARAMKKAVAFGPMFPGREDVVHQVNEHIHIEDLLKATAIYADAIYNLGK